MIQKNTELENKVVSLTNNLRNAENSMDNSGSNDIQQKMAEQIEKLIETQEKLK
mgnify:CR=1 FL=1